MKKLISMALTLLCFISFISCGNKYVDNVPTSEIVKTIDSAVLSDTEHVAAESDFVYFNLGNIDSLILDCNILLAKEAGSNANEIGVFRAKDTQNAKKISDSCAEYLNKKAAHWNYDYNPSENVKIENSKVKVFGTYVVYTVLTPADSELVFVAVENLLTSK